MAPESKKIPEQHLQFGKFAGLREVGVGAKFVGLLDIGLENGGAQNERWNDGAMRVVPDPAEHVKAAEFRHFKIENEKSGKRVFLAVGIRFFPLEVSEDFLTIAAHVDRVLQAGPLQGNFNELDVILVIVCQENVQLSVHTRIKHGNVHQGSDNTAGQTHLKSNGKHAKA